MKKILTFFGLIIFLALLTGCDKLKVKWELLTSPSIKELGEFDKSAINLSKSITKTDIASKAKLEGNYEISKINLKEVYAYLTIDENTVYPDSVTFEVTCDALPLGPTHQGSFKIKPGVTYKNLSEIKVPLPLVSLSALDILNSALNRVFKNNATINFSMKATAYPAGVSVKGFAYMHIEMDVNYLKCVDTYEFVGVVVSNKGPCD